MVKVYCNKNMATLNMIYREINNARTFDEAVDIVRNLCYYNTNKKIGRKVALEIVTMYNNVTGIYN